MVVYPERSNLDCFVVFKDSKGSLLGAFCDGTFVCKFALEREEVK